jgi:hypothetical protein
MESQDYSWAYVTSSRCLNKGPCELVCAYLVVSAASTDSALYDGTDTNGAKIVDLKSAAVTGHPFKPKEPVYCAKGLYVTVGTTVSGIFVQWRVL